MSADRRLKITFFVVVLLALFGFGGWYQFIREDVAGIDAAQDRIVQEAAAPNADSDASKLVAQAPPVEAPRADESLVVAPAPELVGAAAPLDPSLNNVEPVDELPAGASPEPETVATEPEDRLARSAPAASTDVSSVEVSGVDAAAAESLTASEPSAVEEPVSEAGRGVADARVEAQPSAPPAEAAPAVAPAPVFDIVRVEPTGEAVIAGRGSAGDVVELVRNGTVFDRIVADASGNFVFIPQDFPAGANEIVLRSVGANGLVSQSEQSVTVVVAKDLQTTPMVAIVAPDQPTIVLSKPEETQPGDEPSRGEEVAGSAEQGAEPSLADKSIAGDAPAAAATPAIEQAVPSEGRQVASADPGADAVTTAAIRIASVEAETGGGLYVTGEAGPRANVRLYLNDTFVAPAEAAADGTVSFAIGRGVRPGSYRVRLDEVSGEAGTVISRAEVVFVVPELVADIPPVEAPITAAETAPASEVVASSAPREITVVRSRVADETVAGEATAAASGVQPAVGPVAAADLPAIEVAPVEPSAAEARIRFATAIIPEISTAVVTRGDSLWRISRRVYGRGIRYTEIFSANQNQIRNPDLIYPGQLFVLPQDPEAVNEAGASPN